MSVSDLFKARADSFSETMNSRSGNVGFRVPEYQRTYDWSEKNIKRLLEDCLNGFHYLSKSRDESYTFLGTIILASERPEPSFDGISLSVVDGQQRLTTLILLCCALIEELYRRREDVCQLQDTTASWIIRENEFIRERLFDCVIGQLRSGGQIEGFPRLVRSSEDNRGFRPVDRDYRSIIAKSLRGFAEAYRQGNPVFPRIPSDAGDQESRLLQNYDYIKRQVKLGIYDDIDSPDTEHQNQLEHSRIDCEDFRRKGLVSLFVKIDTLYDQAEMDRAMSHIASSSSSSGLIRIMLFSHYLLKSVVLTRVEAKNEDAAFDIFDSLNTTGEPLTAIETFKPRVISFERENTGYNGSKAEAHFKRLEENLSHIEPDKRQAATKELLVTFALYLDGDKLPLNLAAQRNYLRTQFNNATNPDFKRRIVQSLADIAEFRRTYWNRDFIQTLDSFHPNDTIDRLKLCCMFISDMKTSLAIPIMARYWVQYQQDGAEDNFVDAVKALTAFLVLRRSITGNTGRIDSDFRKMMRTLCIGLDHSNSPLGLHNLKAMFKDYLAAPRIEVKNKETWVERVREVPLADCSQPLCRFLLFAASNNARSDQENPGLLKRQGVVHSNELAFLNYSKWLDAKYATVEHVAPESNSAGGWDSKIYEQAHTRHTIGNIILLPQKENASVGNAPWTKKKIFYRALVAQTDEERNDLFDQAEEKGLVFKKQTKDILNAQDRLHMLDPIATVDEWTERIIQQRTKNILELAWDEVAPWLSY